MRPASLPTNTLPPATVGWARAELAFTKPKAHLSLSFATCSAVKPAWLAAWKRVLVIAFPHPFHWGPLEGLNAGIVAQRPTLASGCGGACAVSKATHVATMSPTRA